MFKRKKKLPLEYYTTNRNFRDELNEGIARSKDSPVKSIKPDDPNYQKKRQSILKGNK